ncbi:MAG: ATP-dependent Clp protease ATP-binding subunit [Candidatus Portnoybacteria bacterium]|nr:ATP-dependent Clp protease ATP-binding subunit [Candidatus Portnoybacteria bacterium]
MTFEPNLNLLTIIQRRLKRILGWLVFLFLILFGLYGIWSLILGFSNIFYLSLVTDMFLFYLWQRRKEKIKKIRLPRPKEKIEISLFLNKAAQKSLEKSWLFCYSHGYHFVRPIHLFASFLKKKNFKKILKRLDCQPEKVIEKIRVVLKSSSFFPESEKTINILGPKISADFKKIFFTAYLFCLKQGKQQTGSLSLLWAISHQKNLVRMIFDEFGVSPEEIARVIQWTELEERIKKWQRSFFWSRLFKPKGKLNRTMTAAATPLLDRVSQDLTLLARQGQFEFVVGRQKEIEGIFNFFSSGQSGIILVGPSEVGKKSVLKKLAQMMVKEDVPNFLKDKRLVKLDLASLVSLGGAKERGEEYLKKIIFEVNRAGNIVLVIENIDNLVGLKTQASGLDFAEILASALDQKAFFFVGTASSEGFSSKIEGKILGRLLNKIEVALPSRDLLWQILISKIFIIEKELKILFSADALDQAIDLAERYLYGQALPAKVIALLEEIAYSVRSQRGKDSLIKGSDIIQLVARKTRIPLGQVEETEKEKLLHLEEIIHQRVINQEEAVKAVGAALRRSRLEMARRKKPICNFLFIGPTGVGKTELAKTLARVYFGDEKKMIRLDMSEYQEKRGLRRLIGLRSEEGLQKGYLTEAVKRQPHSLLLLDEIEKAHPDILNLFLQVMDDGRLTDVSGETINFTHVILIATSNAGTHFIQKKISQKISYQEIYGQLKEKVLLEYFRPEFLNRFDKIVLFRTLTMENMFQITQLFLEMVKEKLAKKGVDLEVEEEAVRELAAAGFDPLYGARPLQRVIQDKVENIVARLFLEDKIKRRDKLLLKKGLVFEIKKAPAL